MGNEIKHIKMMLKLYIYTASHRVWGTDWLTQIVLLKEALSDKYFPILSDN